MSNTTQRRAVEGGEFGANGEWYEGGKFINTVAKNAKKEVNRYASIRKQEIAPYVYEVLPDGFVSLYRQLAGVEIPNRANGTFSFNPNLRNEYATPEAIARRTANIAAFNAGERMVKIIK
jgi:hypothetical protein